MRMPSFNHLADSTTSHHDQPPLVRRRRFLHLLERDTTVHSLAQFQGTTGTPAQPEPSKRLRVDATRMAGARRALSKNKPARTLPPSGAQFFIR